MTETRSSGPNGGDRAPGDVSRFRGLPAEARDFFRTLEEQPCPDTMPGGDRAAYAAHILAPLKTLVREVGTLLADVDPPLGWEARAGASLDWPDGAKRNPEECPVRRIRFWDAGSSPDESPLLYATFSADGIEVGLTPSRESTERGARSLPAPTLLPWEGRTRSPELAEELAVHLRELLPFFDELRAVFPPATPAAGER